MRKPKAIFLCCIRSCLKDALLTAIQQQIAAFSHSVCFRHWHTEIPPSETDQAFHQPFLVIRRRVAKYDVQSIVRRQCGIAFLHLGMCAKTILYRNLRVVKNEPPVCFGWPALCIAAFFQRVQQLIQRLLPDTQKN